MKPAPCNCDVCDLLRRLMPIIDRLQGDEKAAMDQLLTEWEGNGMDAAYWEMKAKGTWPS